MALLTANAQRSRCRSIELSDCHMSDTNLEDTAKEVSVSVRMTEIVSCWICLLIACKQTVLNKTVDILH